MPDGGLEGELLTLFYYDTDKRLVQVLGTNAMGGYDKVYYSYGFDGQVLLKLLSHSTSSGSLTERYRYTYDHALRAVDVYHQIGSNVEV